MVIYGCERSGAPLTRAFAFMSERKKAWPVIEPGLFVSGRWDLNPGPLEPHSSALAGLRHAPLCVAHSTSGDHSCQSANIAIKSLSKAYPVSARPAPGPARVTLPSRSVV